MSHDSTFLFVVVVVSIDAAKPGDAGGGSPALLL